MTRRTTAALATLALAALPLAAPTAGAQHVDNTAVIFERTGDFARIHSVCGTGLHPTEPGLLAFVHTPTLEYSCAGGNVFTSAEGGMLKFRASLVGEGATSRPFAPPYASGLGARVARVAQIAVGFDDVLHVGTAAGGRVRFEYELTGEREETPGTPPPGAPPTTPATGANIWLYAGGSDAPVGSFSAPLGTTSVRSYFEVPVTGPTLEYYLSAGGFARLTTEMSGPEFAFVGSARIDFAHTLRIERIAVFDAAGADVTGAAGLTSAVFTFAADGTVTGGRVLATPEPATVALLGAGLATIAALRRRRNG
jgi:hypothetical protein